MLGKIEVGAFKVVNVAAYTNAHGEDVRFLYTWVKLALNCLTTLATSYKLSSLRCRKIDLIADFPTATAY